MTSNAPTSDAAARDAAHNVTTNATLNKPGRGSSNKSVTERANPSGPPGDVPSTTSTSCCSTRWETSSPNAEPTRPTSDVRTSTAGTTLSTAQNATSAARPLTRSATSLRRAPWRNSTSGT